MLSGSCFIGPAFVMVALLAFIYMQYGGIPQVGALFAAIGPEVIGPGGDAPLRLLTILHPIEHRIPEERGQVILAIGEIWLGIDGNPALSGSKDVVVMEVAVHQPLRGWVERGEELARQRHQLATLALRGVEPARNLGRYWAERRAGTTPQA